MQAGNVVGATRESPLRFSRRDYNQEGMRQKYSRTLVIISVVLVMALAYLAFQFQNPAISQNLATDTPTPDVQATQFYTKTVAAERTAIAIFTQNPTLALSSTPFYAQIIYNEVERNLTEIPFPSRPCYLSPTNVPGNPATPIDECGPFIATGGIDDAARELVELMQEVSIEGTAGVVSNGVEQIDKSGNPPFVAVQSTLGFAIAVDTISNRLLMIEIIEKLTDIIIENWANLEYVSTNAEIYVQLNGSDGSAEVLTTYDALYQAHEAGLRGDNLIEALGGFTEDN
jgi:hypothetical protein